MWFKQYFIDKAGYKATQHSPSSIQLLGILICERVKSTLPVVSNMLFLRSYLIRLSNKIVIIKLNLNGFSAVAYGVGKYPQ
jgi:hypothetical protein